uniref:Uncharacterized protein n=1 Tax=Candidatus Kentrum sp. DK TaxID=2126562 RepID=A0A450SJ66_9GAMM|nr:MAG: hypothetical protein BECKDK2373C_GA0170839_100730 [Candidatus Kentron sp. DK]VFJ53473.1 MAG: hypothetical protein BECKDK2373B_GA0170837_104229 [Candidatus Kentron sp. DK]
MHRFTIYSPLNAQKKGDYPISPFLYLSAGFYSEDQGHVLLSAQLMTDSEIDYVVDGLKEELEEFRTKAKNELKALHNKMLKT